MTATIVTAFAWAGSVILLYGYAQTSRGRWAADGHAFQACSVFGSVTLGLAAAVGGVWSSAAVNVAWTAIGVAVLMRGARPRVSSRPAEAGGPLGSAAPVPASTRTPTTSAR